MTHSTFAYPYLGVLLLLIVAVVAFSGTLYLQRIISRALAKKDREKLKLSPYESGVLPNMQKNTISAHFFLLALLFILFDIEVIFMIPWAIDFKLFKSLGLGGFIAFEMLSFVALLVLGFVYAWKKGALKWQNTK
ncbi:NAD(P)H-quinone oxidoreductase subunit 3 [Helicobacter himalayensis]|uniref:NAD(P)H-quinone oxidoreductase subunit 3 n=1 Tax=Helicobacter himalayensis TaxID=1591088 RepID=UPI00083019B0|nr:NAD(P)H-quinone oxidoreductase subunit 3 [Helicobacter himalayensis]